MRTLFFRSPVRRMVSGLSASAPFFPLLLQGYPLPENLLGAVSSQIGQVQASVGGPLVVQSGTDKASVGYIVSTKKDLAAVSQLPEKSSSFIWSVLSKKYAVVGNIFKIEDSVDGVVLPVHQSLARPGFDPREIAEIVAACQGCQKKVCIRIDFSDPPITGNILLNTCLSDKSLNVDSLWLIEPSDKRFRLAANAMVKGYPDGQVAEPALHRP
jgi:hypothetical protein